MASLPPISITQKTVKENCFSKHDNRHAFQNSGVYFGQGLGKRLVEEGRSQHLSDNHTSWAVPPHTTTWTGSTYASDFSQRRSRTARPSGTHTLLLSTPAPSHGSELPLAGKQWQGTCSSLMHKFHIFSKPSFRRFPRTHAHKTGLSPAPPLSEMAKWFPHEHRASTMASATPLLVLAEAQKPFLPHNPWTYSYKS